jgi:hypothetical protein
MLNNEKKLEAIDAFGNWCVVLIIQESFGSLYSVTSD